MPRESAANKRRRTLEILHRLQRQYPGARCALVHENPLQLLVATILSAQCTDARVNMVTPALFARYPDAAALARAPLPELEKAIASTGFFRNKAKAIRSAAADIVNKHANKVPDTMDALTALRGVGRKTANVVLGNAFGKNVGVVVDTHVGRLSRRLGLATTNDAEKMEQALMALVPQESWTLWSHLLIFHGRQVCVARWPACERCVLSDICPAAFKIKPTARKEKK